MTTEFAEDAPLEKALDQKLARVAASPGQSWHSSSMASSSPDPLTVAERHDRRERAARIARDFGFVGRIEYRHVYSQTGGAQYGRGSDSESDLLTVYAEAFERDADPTDFSLAAMIAHERRHQLVVRHARIARQSAGLAEASVEILASILGAMICDHDADRVALLAKATAELLDYCQSFESASHQVQQLWDVLDGLL